MDHSHLPINQVVNRLKEAAQKNEGIVLCASDVEVLVTGLRKGRFTPVYAFKDIIRLTKEGKLSQEIGEED